MVVSARAHVSARRRADRADERLAAVGAEDHARPAARRSDTEPGARDGYLCGRAAAGDTAYHRRGRPARTAERLRRALAGVREHRRGASGMEPGDPRRRAAAAGADGT